MSDTDSFINEVTEEVRQEQLWRIVRRYGWIVVLLIFGIVGGAAWNEYTKSRERQAAQSAGDAIFAALELEDENSRAAALGAARTGLSASAAEIIGFYEAAESSNGADAAAIYARISSNDTLPQVYRDLAVLKAALLEDSGMSEADQRAALEGIAAPGAAFRLLAEEQLAVLDIGAGDTAGALVRLQTILVDAEASRGLRNRVRQLIVSLGGDLEAT